MSKPKLSFVDKEALKSDIRAAIVNKKTFACPIAVRLAWHASGTFDKKDATGGSNGATMRFATEANDGANAGLGIPRDLLAEVKQKNPSLSLSDIWTYAGVLAIEMMGGPKVPYEFGRQDKDDEKACPENGRLPDATQGADHLRDVFYRMGFDDKGIVALSGAHTVGRGHITRSGFDGPWTKNPLAFDNTYFKHLLEEEWIEMKTDAGNVQFTDKATQKLMMLPTDVALIKDAKFKVWVEKYAADQQAFFDDFSEAFGRLISLGCPSHCQPGNPDCNKAVELTPQQKISAEFREAAMHGSVAAMKKVAKEADVHDVDAASGRTALHKAAFWGHELAVAYLLDDLKLDANVQDVNGDSALHDAARFGHISLVEKLLKAGANKALKNKQGKTAHDIAAEFDKPDIAKLLA